MACEHLDSLLRENASTSKAGTDCPECRSARAMLASAREALIPYAPEAPVGSRTRSWQAVSEAADAGGPFGWRPWIGAGAVLAAATVVVLVLLGGEGEGAAPVVDEGLAPMHLAVDGVEAGIEPEDDAPEAVPERPAGVRLVSGTARSIAEDRIIAMDEIIPAGIVEVPRQARIDLGIGRMDLDEGARLTVASHEEPGASVTLDRGRLRADIDPRRATGGFEVVTAHGRIEVVGTTFTVQSDPRRTEVWVETGGVRVWPEGEDVAVRLEAGEGIVLPRPRARDADRPRSPAPERAPAPQLEPEPAPELEPAPVPERVTERAPERVRDAEPARAVREARQAVATDPDRAADLAGRVLESRPDPAVEALALAVLADAHRLRGESGEAARLYRRVADHPEAQGFAEEALLRLALLRMDAGLAGDALAIVDESDRRFEGGVLAPERAGLRARAHLLSGRPNDAAAALEALSPGVATLEIQSLRVAVAEALVATDPRRAGRLVRPVLEGPVPPAVRLAAEAVAGRVEGAGPSDTAE